MKPDASLARCGLRGVQACVRCAARGAGGTCRDPVVGGAAGDCEAEGGEREEERVCEHKRVHLGRRLARAFLLLLHDAVAVAARAALLHFAPAALALRLQGGCSGHLGGDGLHDRRRRRRRRLAAHAGGGKGGARGGHGHSLVHGALFHRLVARPRQRQHRGSRGRARAAAQQRSTAERGEIAARGREAAMPAWHAPAWQHVPRAPRR